MSDPAEAEVMRAFFGEGALHATLAALCLMESARPDPITHILTAAATSPLQIQLTRIGLQPFAGKGLTVPYHHMSAAQRELLAELVSQKPWKVLDNVMVYRRSGERTTLPTVDLLHAVCADVLASQRHPDPRARLAICNILLQRVQASVPLSPALQADLNLRLFPPQSPALQADPNPRLSPPQSPALQADPNPRLFPPLSPALQADPNPRLFPPQADPPA